ncbi:MAG: copper amine oxidase N-terminal domain-containing protein [Paludibacter sp.]|nr:copper amine oxidase N-terminal domain-containing protein [Paludibacter sp.]
MKKISFFLFVIIFSINSIYCISANSDITVTYNSESIKFDQPPVIQNNRVLVPLRNIADSLGVKIEWDGEQQKVFFFNRQGQGYFLYINDPTLYCDNGAGIKIDKLPLDVAPLIINNRTMVPLRVIAESFDLNVNWDDNTKTVSISDSNKESTDSYSNIQIEYNGKFYNLYELPGTGKYSDWRQLKGFPDKNLLNVYFQHDTNHISYKTEYTGKYDFEKPVTWTDQLGLTHNTTIGELFAIQTDIGSDAIHGMEEKYGAMYDEWFELLTIDYDHYVQKYLIGIGEMTNPNSDWRINPVIDAPPITDLTNKRTTVTYDNNNYDIYSIESTNKDWRQLKGFYGEDFMDVFFALGMKISNDTYEVKYNISLKEPFEKDIIWIGLDNNTNTTKIDVYNAAIYKQNPSIIEYYADKGIHSYIISAEDKKSYDDWYYYFNGLYKQFVIEHLQSIGIKSINDEKKNRLFNDPKWATPTTQ